MARPHIEPFVDRDVDFKKMTRPGFPKGMKYKVLSLDTDTGYHAKSDATSTDVVVGSTVEVDIDFGAGFGQGNASPDPSTVLGPATDVTVVK